MEMVVINPFSDVSPDLGYTGAPVSGIGQRAKASRGLSSSYAVLALRTKTGSYEPLTNLTRQLGKACTWRAFAVLRNMDRADHGGNSDGRLGVGDEEFANLRAWRDFDADGRISEAETFTLDQVGVSGFDLRWLPIVGTPVGGARLMGRIPVSGVVSFAYGIAVSTERRNP